LQSAKRPRFIRLGTDRRFSSFRHRPLLQPAFSGELAFGPARNAMTQISNEEAQDFDFEDHTEDFRNMNDLDYARVLLPDLDYEAQLIAIRNLLRQHMLEDRLLSDDIKKIESYARQTSGMLRDHAVDEWVDRLHESVYQDAAHSMAAVGMLAPLFESLFFCVFSEIGDKFCGSFDLSNHPRWQKGEKIEWDCHFFWEGKTPKKSLVEGIFQLADGVGLTPFLPNNTRPALNALIKYRNKMFHCGFEWPEDERSKFAELIEHEHWPESWFRAATRDGRPWIYYMTDAYISDCVTLMENVIAAIGRFARQLPDRLTQPESTTDREAAAHGSASAA
jgi:hypothetical protein